MSFFDTAVERTATLSASLCVAAFDPTGASQAIAAATVAGVGLITLFQDVASRNKLECDVQLRRLTETVKERLIAQDARFSSEYEDASERLGAVLVRSMPSVPEFARHAASPKGFLEACTNAVLEDLKAKGAGFDRDPVYQRFAATVIGTALEAALEDQKVFAKLVPHFWTEALKGIGDIRVATQKIVATQEVHTQALEMLSQAQHAPDVFDAFLERGYEDPASILDARPTAVLVARYGAIPFLAINDQLNDILAWSMRPAALAGRLYAGRGGIGKTRLLLEACVKLGAEGWVAGFLTKSSIWSEVGAFDAFANALFADKATSALLVIDYAEMREHDIRELAKRLRGDRFKTKKVRVVCIARSGGEWWQGLTDRDGSPTDFFEQVDRYDLDDALPIDVAQHFWRHCAASFAERLGQTAPEPPGWFDDPGREDDLYPLPIAIDAYLALAGGKGAQRSLLAALAARERPLWKRAIGAEDPINALRAESIVSSATLLQGVELDTRPAAETPLDVVRHIPIEQQGADFDLDNVAYALRVLYPSKSALGPIEPDILGEHIIGGHLLALEQPEWRNTRRRKPFAQDYIRTLWSLADSQQRFWLLTVLNRATRALHQTTGIADAAEKAIEALGDLPFDEPEITARACLTEVGRLATLISLQFERAACEKLQRLMASVSLCHDSAKSAFSRDLQRTIDRRCRTQSIEVVEELMARSARQGELGRQDESLELAIQATKVVAAPLVTIAALIELSERFYDLEHFAEALDTAHNAAEKAAALDDSSELARHRYSEARLVEAETLLSLGRVTEAEETVLLAIPGLRVAVDIGGDLDRLTRARLVYYNCLLRTGRSVEAETGLREVVRIAQTELGRDRSGTHFFILGDALLAHSQALTAVGAQDEALARAEHAVDIFRRMGTAFRGRALQKLTSASIILSRRLAAMGRHRDALKIAREAIAVSGHDHAAAKANLAEALFATGELDEATALQRELYSYAQAHGGPGATIAPLVALSQIALARGDIAEATILARSAWRETEGVVSPEHPASIAASTHLASIMVATGEHDEARLLLESMIEYFSSEPNADEKSALSLLNASYAQTLVATGDIRSAANLQYVILQDANIELGPEHPRTIDAALALASSYRALGDLDSAIDQEKRVFKLSENAHGMLAAPTLKALASLAASTLARDVGEGIKWQTDLAERLIGMGEGKSLEFRQALLTLARAHRTNRDYVQALRLLAELEEAFERDPRPGPFDLQLVRRERAEVIALKTSGG